jgi:ADP-ribosylglycohydrolase
MNPETYKDLIRFVLSHGGDTDTNGAIVGGLIGAIVGFKNLPPEYLKKQFQVKMSNI